MRSLIAMLIIAVTCFFQPTYAASSNPQLNIKISGVSNKHYYYLCIYGVGCLNMKTANQGKFYPIIPMDLGNIKKLVITDIRTMQMYPQPVNKSCNIQVKSDQKVTISGHVTIINNSPVLDQLNCSLV